jgi:hypothetical protein
MRAGDANGGIGGRWVLQVFSLQKADKYLCGIQMRIIDAAHGKLQSEQTISSDQFVVARPLPSFDKQLIRDYPRRS